MSKPIDANEARRRIKAIQSSGGVDRQNFPEDMKGELAREKWDDHTFDYGMEYGYLLAMLDIVNGTDSVTPSSEDEVTG